MRRYHHSNPHKAVKYLSATELEKFFSVLRKAKSPRDELAFVLMYAFGLRVGELVRIRLDDIKPDLAHPVEIFIHRLKNGVSRHYKLEITEWFHLMDKAIDHIKHLHKEAICYQPKRYSRAFKVKASVSAR